MAGRFSFYCGPDENRRLPGHALVQSLGLQSAHRDAECSDSRSSRAGELRRKRSRLVRFNDLCLFMSEIIACVSAATLLLAASSARATTDPEPMKIIAQATTAYRAQAFDRFFGVIAWARANDWPGFETEARDRIQALEVMALARNCRWRELKAIRSALNSSGPATHAAFAHAQMKSDYPKMDSDAEAAHRTTVENAALRQANWAARTSDLVRLKDPLNVRVRLSSQCASH